MIALYIFIGVASISAFGVLLSKTVLHSALSLIVCLLAIAGIYVLLSAEFLAVVQILVYAGGILLLIIFGIMVTQRNAVGSREKNLPGILLMLALMVALSISISSLDTGVPSISDRSVDQIGVSLMTRFAGPFEFGGLLILVSMIGAMVTASQQHRAK